MPEKPGRNATLLFGLVLIFLGLIFLLGQFIHIEAWRYIIPLFVAAAGLAFFAGMLTRGRDAANLAIPGAMLLILGLVMLYQVMTGAAESWAYTWTLVMPTGLGIGMVLAGLRNGSTAMQRIGEILTVVGLFSFVVLGTFFELIAGLMGAVTPGRFLVPVGLIALGLLLLFGRQIMRWLFEFETTRIFGPPMPGAAMIDAEPSRKVQEVKPVERRES